jgi:hypothetical protein
MQLADHTASTGHKGADAQCFITEHAGLGVGGVGVVFLTEVFHRTTPPHLRVTHILCLIRLNQESAPGFRGVGGEVGHA